MNSASARERAAAYPSPVPRLGWAELNHLSLWLAVLVCILAVAFYWLNIQTGWDSFLLLLVLNVVFVVAPCLVIAVISSRAFIRSGSWPVLWLGAGTLSYGLAVLLSLWLRALVSPNAQVTAFAFTYLLAGILFLVGALWTVAGPARQEHKPAGRRLPVLAGIYIILLAVIAVIAVVSDRGVLPVFFVPGQGSTALRDIVQVLALACFLTAGLTVLAFYLRSEAAFLRWYGFGLLLTVVNTAGNLALKSFGTPFNWTLRGAQLLAGVYFLAAGLSLLREARVKNRPVSDVITDYTLQDTQRALKDNLERLGILSEANSLLLAAQDPEKVIQTIATRVMHHLRCDCFFNFIGDKQAGKLRLNAYAGIPPETAKAIEWLDYGVAICGCAARDGCRIISEDVQENGDARAALVRSFGVQAYACHPLQTGLETIGTLSFGTRTRTHFTDDELGLMRTIANQVSIAMVRKLDEDNLKRYAAELERANQELEAFSYSVSHDLRAPLRALDGFSQIVAEDYAHKLDDAGKDYLQRVRSASQRMSQIIDDLLKLSRLTRAEMHIEKVNLTALVLAISQELQAGGKDRQAEFVIAPQVAVEGDSSLLTLALRNLLDNAWKYTTKCPQARIEFGSMLDSGKPVYFVRDNGVGFDMQFANKLFQPFQRLHTDQEYSGTGIGLAIVQRVIERHRGRVWAESNPGQGATFYFTVG